MPAPWPRIFTSSNENSLKPASKLSSRADRPVFQAKDLNYFYSSSRVPSTPHTPGQWSLPGSPFTPSPASSSTKSSSPLRNDYFGSTATSSKKRTSQSNQRPALLRNFTAEHYVHYPVLRSESPTSSTYSHSSVASQPRSILSKGTRTPPGASPRRPALKQNHTWHGKTTNKPHVSFVNPNRTETLNMHPLLASSRSHPAPISYNVVFPPSPETLLDRSTRTPLPRHTLHQPATDPVTHSKLVLKSEKFPWTIIVTSQTQSKARTQPVGYSSTLPVTNYDVFQAIHNTLHMQITQEEWAALGHGSRTQRKATRAYEKRCLKMGGGWDEGVRRVDVLGTKSLLVGIEVDKESQAEEGRVAKLLFAEA